MNNSNQQPLPPQQPTGQPTPLPSSGPSKTFIILIVLIIIAAVGVGGYILGTNQNQTIVQNQSQPVIPLTTNPSPTPTVDPTANWETYTNSEIGFGIELPQSWEIKKIEKVDGVETVWLYLNSPYKTPSTVKDLEIIIGSPFVYSTSGALCANQTCEKETPFEVKIAGKTYSAQVIKASVGEEKKFERYSFQIETEASLPYITGTYFTQEEQKEIIQILSTFKFTD